jgi:hypothetical protein
MSDRYEPHAPCPHCFESSGFAARIIPDSYWEPGYAEPDPLSPCPYCEGTGVVPADDACPDGWDEYFYDPGYLTALDKEVATKN